MGTSIFRKNPFSSTPEENIDEYIYGAKYYEADAAVTDIATGFAKLMFKMATHSDKDLISDIFKQFRFTKFSPCHLKDSWSGPNIYFVPKSIKEDFINSCTDQKFTPYNRIRRKTSSSDGSGADLHGRHRLRSCKVPPAGFEFYSRETFLGILGYFYTEICALVQESRFAKKPDPLFCWILANQALRDKEELEHIGQNCNQCTEEELSNGYDKVIREMYEDAKPSDNPYEGRVDVGQQP